MTEDKCTRCGQCCFFEEDGKIKKCPYLLIMPQSKTTFCRIYPTRLGTKIGKNAWCNNIDRAPYDYAGCPYNTGKRPMKDYTQPISNLMQKRVQR